MQKNKFYNLYNTLVSNPKSLYTYTLWITIFSILYFFNYLPYSLLYTTSIVIIIVSLWQIFIGNKNIYYKITIFLFELILFILNYYKHFYYDKKKLFELNDILFNILLFIMYNIFLLFNKTNFINIYLKPPYF